MFASSLVLAVGVAYGASVARLWRNAGVGQGIARGQAAAFACGWLALAAALVSPLDELAERLFAAHMAQHELLMVVAAPLVALASPLVAFMWTLPRGGRRTVMLWVRDRGAQRRARRAARVLAARLVSALRSPGDDARPDAARGSAARGAFDVGAGGARLHCRRPVLFCSVAPGIGEADTPSLRFRTKSCRSHRDCCHHRLLFGNGVQARSGVGLRA